MFISVGFRDQLCADHHLYQHLVSTGFVFGDDWGVICVVDGIYRKELTNM
jgi:hypothetical protein